MIRRSGGASRVAGGLLFCTLALSGCDPSPAEGEAANVAVPLSSTFESPEALAEAVLEAFGREDAETLKTLPLTKEEFRLHVWPKLPASRPERGLPFDYGWGDLHQKSIASIAGNFARYKGRKLELLSIRFKDGRTDYGTFVVHRESEMRVKDPESGIEFDLSLFGSVMEYRGRYKIFSYVTD
jgi:hypothetical protein